MGLPAVITGKECTKCGIWKPFNEYYIHQYRNGKAYAINCCKTCKQLQSREWIVSNRPKRRLQQRRQRSTPLGKYSQYISFIKSKYGITQYEFELMLCDQMGRCAICNEKLISKLCVDHCHRQGRVRGILCDPCNINLLPAVEHYPHLLNIAKDYLKAAA